MQLPSRKTMMSSGLFVCRPFRKPRFLQCFPCQTHCCFSLSFFRTRQSGGPIWVGLQHRTSPSPANALHSFTSDTSLGRLAAKIEHCRVEPWTDLKSVPLSGLDGTGERNVMKEKFMTAISDFNKAMFHDYHTIILKRPRVLRLRGLCKPVIVNTCISMHVWSFQSWRTETLSDVCDNTAGNPCCVTYCCVCCLFPLS